MAFKKRFQVSDESINCYGFWILTSGVDLSQAKRNCPAYFMHRTWDIPLGHWEDITVEGDKIFATIVIEGGNELEKEYIRKIENGDIKGASGGFDTHAWSTEALYVKEGQTGAALVKSLLFEISLAPLPGNTNSLSLRKGDAIVTLSAENQHTHIPTLKSEPDMKQIALKLGLPEGAGEAEILAAIVRLNRAKKQAELMRKHIEGEAESLPEEQKTLFVNLCKTDFNSALQFLKLNKPATEAPAEDGDGKGAKATVVAKDVKVTDLIKNGKANMAKSNAEANQSFDYLQKHNPVELARIRKEDPDTYAELAKGYQNGVRHTPTK